MREKGFNKSKQFMMSNSVQYRKATNLFFLKITFDSSIYAFSWAGNIIVYAPIQGTNREKYFIHVIYEGKMATLAGIKRPFVHFFLHRPRFFHLSTEKVRVQSVRKGHQIGYSRADTKNININKRANVREY